MRLNELVGLTRRSVPEFGHPATMCSLTLWAQVGDPLKIDLQWYVYDSEQELKNAINFSGFMMLHSTSTIIDELNKFAALLEIPSILDKPRIVEFIRLIRRMSALHKELHFVVTLDDTDPDDYMMLEVLVCSWQ